MVGRTRWTLLGAAIALLVQGAAGMLPAAQAKRPHEQRLFLASAPGGTAFYTSDPDDPELTGEALEQRCNIFINPQPTRLCQFSFLPAAQMSPALSWSPAEPLRFHVELGIDAPADRSVTFFVQATSTQYETPAAVEVSPGVWEAQLVGPGAVPEGVTAVLGVRVRALGPTVAMRVALRGHSWVDVTAPVEIQSAPELIARSPGPRPRDEHRTAQRRFVFNDRDWSAWTFSGDLTATRTFDLVLPRDATAVYAWTESDDGPLLLRAADGEVDPRWHTDLPDVRIVRDGVSRGDGGIDARAVRDFAAGAMSVIVRRSSIAQDLPYVLHVVAVHGDRTLASMSWRTTIPPTTQGVTVATCSGASDPVVVPATVTTFAVDLDWVGLKPLDRWALAYTVPGVGSVVCNDRTTDDRLRFTVPPASRTWLFDPRLTADAPQASAYDTELYFEVSFAYAALGRG